MFASTEVVQNRLFKKLSLFLLLFSAVASADPGRSYFDHVFSRLENGQNVYNIPYPFQKMMDRLREYQGSDGIQTLLFPMGRSLQKNAALRGVGLAQVGDDLFFRFPRLILAVDQEPKKSGVLNLRGRLFLGFHEKAKSIEAISYNDMAGRFEFQIIQDYSAGKNPKVVYANRQLCLSCHQSESPIFSNGPWQESNAHAEIYTRLQKQIPQKKYFGASLVEDLNTASSYDNLVNRANFFQADQKIWSQACSSGSCRRELVKIIIHDLLTETMTVDPDNRLPLLKTLKANFASEFPQGLKIPEAKIPNRNPLQHSIIAEPFALRPSSETWENLNWSAQGNNRFISNLKDYFSLGDIAEIDQMLAQKNGEDEEIHLQCQIKKTKIGNDFDLSLVCPGNLDINIDSSFLRIKKGQVVESQINLRQKSENTWRIRHVRGQLQDNLLSLQLLSNASNLRWRFPNGQVFSDLQIDLENGHLTGKLLKDFKSLDLIIDQIDLSGNFSAHKIYMAIMGLKDHSLEDLPLQIESSSITSDDVMNIAQDPIANFNHSCAQCHYNSEQVPPAFLGDKPFLPVWQNQCERIQACAPRMLYRLKMRNCSQEQVGNILRNPMPMISFLNDLKIEPEKWQKEIAPTLIAFARQTIDKADLRKYLLRKKISSEEVDKIIFELMEKDCPNVDAKTYDQLPTCQFLLSKTQKNSLCEKLRPVYENN